MVEAVSKSGLELPEELLPVLGLDPGLFRRPEPPAPPVVPFTPLAEIDKAVGRRLSAWDWGGLLRQAVQDRIDRARGRV